MDAVVKNVSVLLERIKASKVLMKLEEISLSPCWQKLLCVSNEERSLILPAILRKTLLHFEEVHLRLR